MFRLGLSGTVGTNSLPLTNQWTASRNFVISNQSAYAPFVECHTITEFQAQIECQAHSYVVVSNARNVYMPA